MVHKWYHLLPKHADISKGLMSPYYMMKHNMRDMALHSVDKYRNRIVHAWEVFPEKNPDKLTLEEIMDGLNQFRGVYGSRSIYLFRYPPCAAMGPNMEKLLRHRDIYEVDLSKVKLAYVDYKVNDAPGERWFTHVTPFEYFKDYDDNAEKQGKLLFGGIPHIAVATEDGRIPKSALRKVEPKLLYHGAHAKHDVLKPHVNPAYPNLNVVFGTDSYPLALTFSGNKWNDLEINQTFVNGTMILTEILPGMFQKKFNTSGYIHHMIDDGFYEIPDHPRERASQWEVKPIKIEKVQNVLQSLFEQEVKMHTYPNCPDFIPDRLQYIKSKCEKYGIRYTDFILQHLK